MTDHHARLTDIARELDAIVATLDEISFDVLREARRDGGDRPTIDRTITQARRALEKASRLLSSDATGRDEFDD